jgi:hypothetical protein
MLSFRSIFVAAVALATFTSAIPVGPDVISGGSNDLLKRGGGEPISWKPPGDIVKTCYGSIVPIVANIGQFFFIHFIMGN